MSPNDRKNELARLRVTQCALIALAFALWHCADPAVGPRPTDIPGTALDVRSASVWTATILPLTRGVTSSAAHDVNNAGVVVGVVTVQGETGPHAARWVNGVMSLLGEPKGINPSTIVERINNSNISVGHYNPGIGENKAVRWNAAGIPTVLLGLQGSSADWAFDINDDSVIVGESQHRAARWVGGVVEDLHPPAYAQSRALGISNGGEIVGWVEYKITGERRAYLWRMNGMDQELGVLQGDVHSMATAVNNAFTVVGNSGDLLSVSRAFRWTNPLGISNSNLGAPKTLATGISDFDRLVGYREIFVNNVQHAIALTQGNGIVDVLPNPYRKEARARGVNLCGDIAGTLGSAASVRAVLWTKSTCDP